MDTSSLTRFPGELCGRLPKAPAGWRYVLGSLAEWDIQPLVSGDYTEISQVFDAYGFIGMRVHIRFKHPPLSLTGGKVWGVQLYADGVASPVRVGWPGRERQFDVFVPFASSASHQPVEVRVRLVLQ